MNNRWFNLGRPRQSNVAGTRARAATSLIYVLIDFWLNIFVTLGEVQVRLRTYTLYSMDFYPEKKIRNTSDFDVGLEARPTVGNLKFKSDSVISSSSGDWDPRLSGAITRVE